MSVAHHFVIKLEQCFLSRINTNGQPITFLATVAFIDDETPACCEWYQPPLCRLMIDTSVSIQVGELCNWHGRDVPNVWKHYHLESGLRLTETSEWGRAATNWVGRRIFSPSITSLTPPRPTQPLTLLNIHISTLCPPLYPFILAQPLPQPTLGLPNLCWIYSDSTSPLFHTLSSTT